MSARNVVDTEKRTLAENASSFFLSVCVGFTTVMVAVMALGSVFADESARQGIGYCWSVFGVCVAAALLQFVFFTPVLIKRLSYSLRLALFGICLFAALSAVAVAMNWFPADMPSAWIMFAAIFLVVFGVLALVFAFKQKRDSRELNERLRRYRDSEAQ